MGVNNIFFNNHDDFYFSEWLTKKGAFSSPDTLKNQILSSKGKMKKYFFTTVFEQNVMLLLQREQTIYFKRKTKEKR